MSDELPQTGGAYERAKDGSLKPQTKPRKAKAKPEPEKEA